MEDLLLQVKDLKTYFYTDDGIVKAVDGIDFTIKKGETLGMVGESGCGKSVSALSILQLVQDPPGEIINGEIWFKGEDLLKKKPEQMRKIRGNDISMIFQEPMTSLNPVYTIGEQISEAIILHQKLNKGNALEKTVEMLKLVGIANPERRVHGYPHELSGGQRQRVMIAMALSCNPDLLIADEPTTALDVTIQAQILELIKKLKDEIGMAVLMITHNLGVIAEVSDHVVVVYAGKAVEYADVTSIFKHPKHPYAMALQKSIPQLTDKPGVKLEVIEGNIPDPLALPTGCKFHPRCKFAINICKKKEPELEEIGDNHIVRCWMYNKENAINFKTIQETVGVTQN
ncbi:MAG: ABC transporter ATP-binding protein [Candidatus Atribacteria bacterium]|nr:ABC transporter ATP-binding protein [Candidatus Atribacteria bacterium]